MKVFSPIYHSFGDSRASEGVHNEKERKKWKDLFETQK